MAELKKEDPLEQTTPISIDPASATHRVKNMKVGKNGVQLLVSSGNQLYDVEDIEAGDSAWQSVGSWNDEVFIKVAETIQQRQTQADKSENGISEKAKDGRRGLGQRLGTVQGLADAN